MFNANIRSLMKLLIIPFLPMLYIAMSVHNAITGLIRLIVDVPSILNSMILGM